MPEDSNETKVQQQTGPSDDFVSDYANNIAFEQTVWDLKLIFGEFSGRTNNVEWHTSLTVPWTLAKLMVYYLQVNIAAYEMRSGTTLKVPVVMLPPPLPPLPPEQHNIQLEREIFAKIQEMREKFLQDQES
jgi:hypothetical protein